MPDLRTDLEALRDAWLKYKPYRHSAHRLTALLAKHVKAPAGPDLRAMVRYAFIAGWMERANYEWCSTESESANIGADRYADAVPEAAAEPAAPKEWRGPVECTDCGAQWDSDPVMHMKNGEICHGTLVPFERRKGGGW